MFVNRLLSVVILAFLILPTNSCKAEEGKQEPLLSLPFLVVDLDGDEIELTKFNEKGSVYWDIDNDKFAEATGWVSGGDGLLAIDLNRDNLINHPAELFNDPSTNQQGFVALAAYDTHEDDLITIADARFNDLLVWIDSDADGYSDDGELHTLDQLGITSISLNYSEVSHSINGNEIKQESTFTINDNIQDIVEAWFAYDNANTTYSKNFSLDARTLDLPSIRGYGQLPDLHVAMSLDQDLLDAVKEIATVKTETIFSPSFDLKGKIETIMYRWAGVDSIDLSSRGENIDARQIGFLEKFSGRAWKNKQGSSDPTPEQAALLKDAFKNALGNIAVQLLVQTDAKSLLFPNGASYNLVKGIVEASPSIDYVRFLDGDNEEIRRSDKNDAYVYYSGQGNQIISDKGGNDRIQFATGIAAKQVHVSRVNNDLHLLINIKPHSETIKILDHFGKGSKGVEQAVFSDGRSLDLLDPSTPKGRSQP